MAEQRRWYFCQDDSGLLPGGDRLQLATTLNALCSPRSNALCFPGTKPPEPERWA